ncbi:alpha/beta fold hydrolase [Leifsonia lichenia]
MALGSNPQHPHHSHGPFSDGFFHNPDFDFELRVVLGHAFSGAADTGEVLAAVESVGEHDHEAWFAAWLALGSRIRAAGDDQAAAGNDISASRSYLRASTYLGTALNAVASLPSSDALLSTFRAHRAAWDRFVDTTPVSIHRVSIPYEGAALPGYFFRPWGLAGSGRTLIMNNGSDGAISTMWASGGAGALQRGYNVLMFDGPGQQAMLFEHGVPFRHDWEAVITPVVDYLLGRDDVDRDKIAIYGISQGGYWVPRALAFEHRIAAAVVDPGVVDVSTSWTGHLPKSMLKLLAEGEREKFDRDMELAMKFSPELARTWEFQARPYQKDGYFDTITAVLNYRLDNVASSIRTPLLITDPEDEQFWPGQSRRLAELTPGVSSVVPFTADEGANFHCEPLARSLVDQRMFDWLDARLA